MRIFTSYFAKQKKRNEEGTAYVSIAVGNPKYEVAFNIIDLKCLKPYGVFGKYHGEEYKKKYFERLDSFGVDYIAREIKKVGSGCKEVILMCHEKNPLECHRSMFAEWWLMKTGEIIEEWGEEKQEAEKEKGLQQISFFDIM